jgi:hypothetical protein
MTRFSDWDISGIAIKTDAQADGLRLPSPADRFANPVSEAATATAGRARDGKQFRERILANSKLDYLSFNSRKP